MPEIQEQSGALITLPDMPAAELVTSDKIEELLDEIEKKVESFPVDMDSKKGRDECGSNAYAVSRSKTLVAKIMQKVIDSKQAEIEEQLDEIKRIKTLKKTWEQECDELRDKARAPAGPIKELDATPHQPIIMVHHVIDQHMQAGVADVHELFVVRAIEVGLVHAHLHAAHRQGHGPVERRVVRRPARFILDRISGLHTAATSARGSRFGGAPR